MGEQQMLLETTLKELAAQKSEFQSFQRDLAGAIQIIGQRLSELHGETRRTQDQNEKLMGRIVDLAMSVCGVRKILAPAKPQTPEPSAWEPVIGGDEWPGDGFVAMDMP